MPKTIEKSEVLRMLKEENEPEMKAVISVLIITGARVSEVLMLKGKDITADEKYIYFNMRVLKKRNDKEKRIIRKVPKENIFINYLRKWINDYNSFDRDDLIFMYSRKKVWQKIKKLNPEISPHTFRHTLATWMLDKVDMRTAQEWFCWTNLNTAQVYTHPKDAIDKFSNELGGILE
jgi:integrase